MQPSNATPQRSSKPKKNAPRLELRVGMKSDVGPKRKLNEDYAGYRLPDDENQRQAKGAIFVVADGMGGHQAGEVASKEAVTLVIKEYYADAARPPGDSLVRAIRLANRVIHDHALSDPSKSGMGTTLVAAAILGPKVFVANVGDSRAYLVGGQSISQITEDHSWVEEQIQAGLLRREEAARHRHRNLITRALGSKSEVEVDLFEGQLGEGDALLLCTDGVCGPLPDQEMAQAVRSADPPQAAAQLVTLAGSRSGDDNATVLIVQAAVPAPKEQPADREQTVISPTPRLRIPALPGLPGLQERLDTLASFALSKPYRPVVLALTALTLLFCLVAFVALVWGGDPLPKTAPRPAGVYENQLSALDQEQVARYLGYPGFAEMQQAHGGALDATALASSPLWPAEWCLYLSGKARDWSCTAQTCTFTLESAGEEYQVSYPAPEGESDLGRARVQVYGRGNQVARTIDARLVVRSNRWWAWWSSRQETVYQAQPGEETWVYGIIDESPNGLIEPGDQPWQQRGNPILLVGHWQEADPAPIFRYRQAYCLEENRYVPVAGEPGVLSLPTSTVAPTPTALERSEPDPTKEPERKLFPLPTLGPNGGS